MKYKYLHPAALPPVYATAGSACFDLHATSMTTVMPGQTEKIGTGLAFEIPEGHVMLLFSRSGHAAKFGIRLANCVGVIDSDYRGEVQVMLHNDSRFMYTVKAQERVAQAMIMQIPQVKLIMSDDLSETERGAGGFGSTG